MEIFFYVILFLVFLASLIIQIRDWIYMSRYHKPVNPDVGCNYYYKELLDSGFTISECKNVFYIKKYMKNNRQCPLNCQGKKYKGTTENFEIMSSTEKLYVAKKILLSLGSILGMFLTVLNIIEKI